MRLTAMTRLARWCSTGLAAVGLVACGLPGKPSTPMGSTPSPRAETGHPIAVDTSGFEFAPPPGPGLGLPAPSTLDPHYAPAVREVIGLLRETPLPPGAARIGDPHRRPITGAVLGLPLASNLIDYAGFWSVPLPLATAWAWEQQHLSSTLHRYGATVSGSYLGSNFYGEALGPTPNSSASFTHAVLDVGMIGDGQGRSLIRADGTDIWITTGPTRYTSSGTAVRVRVADGCPLKVPASWDVTNAGGWVSDRLLPPGRPTGGLICQISQRGRRATVRSRPLGPATAQDIARTVAGIPLGSEGTFLRSCPMMALATPYVSELIALSYTSQPDADLRLPGPVCDTERLDNGRIEAALGLGPLIQLLQPPWS